MLNCNFKTQLLLSNWYK